MSDLPEEFDGSSASITDEQKAKLKLLFPEIITEGGKIDFDRLKLTLGESVDAGKERYGMNWPGKADCFKTIQRPSMATLVLARDESVITGVSLNKSKFLRVKKKSILQVSGMNKYRCPRCKTEITITGFPE